MADQKSDPQPKQAEQPKAPPKAAPAKLGAAGESGNPLVHQLLAQRDIAVSNGDKDAADAVTGQLAELGVE